MNELSNVSCHSYESSLALKKELVWTRLKEMKLSDMVALWAKGLTKNTRNSYLYAFSVFDKKGILNIEINLQQFALVNHSLIMRRIKESFITSATAQARSAAYISFTRYLHALTEGIFPIALPIKFGTDRTFRQVREKVLTEVFKKDDLHAFMTQIFENGHMRLWLICVMMLQGARRISEVLNLNIEDIDWDTRIIRFAVFKSSLERSVFVCFPVYIMDVLRDYIGERKAGPAFITHSIRFCGSEKKRRPMRVSYRVFMTSFYRESRRLGLRLTTHMFRTSAITYLRGLGLPDIEIIKVTGHASSRMLTHYDKNSTKNNFTLNHDIMKTYRDEVFNENDPHNTLSAPKPGEHFPELEKEMGVIQKVS